MFTALMRVQWKGTRGAVFLSTLFGFAIPLASVQIASENNVNPAYLVVRMQAFGIAYALLAAGGGLIFAILAWSADHKGRHVYALALPVNRSRYAAMRLGAGALFLTLPALGVLVGSLIAVLIAPIPPGLHGYPFALAFRFLLASAVAFTIFFAIASSTPKAAGMILGMLASLLVVSFLLSAISVDFSVLDHAGEFLFSEPGPLSVFTGRWMLIDA